MNISVKITSNPLTQSEQNNWNQFALKEHPEGTLFHSMHWNEVLNKTYHLPYFLLSVSSDTGELQGTLTLYLAKSLTGKKELISVPYTVYGGLLAKDHAAAELLCQKAAEIAKEQNAEFVALRNCVPNTLNLPGTDLHTYFKKQMGKNEEEILASVKRKSRATIRNATHKFGLTYEINRDWELLWHLHAVNLMKLGTPVFPRKYFKNLIGILGDKADILFVKHQGKAVCGVMTFYYRDVCNPYFSGSLPEANLTGANNYMYYAVMVESVKKGFKYFDFGKSRIGTGAYTFKINMGFEPKKLPYQYILNTAKEVPNINPSNPKYALFIKLWSRQPLWTSKLIGPLVNRYFP